MQIVSKFAYALRKRREELELTQRMLGKLTKHTNKQISKYERGDRIPTRLKLKQLEDVLGRLPSPYRFRPPKHNEVWRGWFRDHRKWRRPKDRSLSSRLKAARTAYADLMKTLDEVCRSHQSWSQAADTGSSLELVACLRTLLSRDAVELSVRPIAWGFRDLPVCDPITGECMADIAFPAMGLQWDGCQAVLVPQVGLMTKDGPIVVDFLVALRIGRRTIWFALEIDGPGHCSKADKLRAAHLEVTRITEAEIVGPNFLDILKARLRGMLDIPRATTKRAA